jgi:AAT family amino acid transporter
MAGREADGCHLTFTFRDPAEFALAFVIELAEFLGCYHGRRNGVPHRALLASTAGIIAAILLAIFAPKNAFLMLYGTAVAGMLFVWLVILNTHLRFRKAITRERLLSLPMRLWAHPFFTVVGILLLLAISLTTFFIEGLQWSVPTFSVFLGMISLLYLRSRRRNT